MPEVYISRILIPEVLVLGVLGLGLLVYELFVLGVFVPWVLVLRMFALEVLALRVLVLDIFGSEMLVLMSAALVLGSKILMGIRTACVDNVSAVKCSRIHSQSFQNLEVGGAELKI